MKYVGWAIAIIVAALTVNFAVHNFVRTPIDLWPLPFAVDLPLFAIVLIAVFFGFCVGIVVAWLSSVRRRDRAARNARDLRQMSAQLGVHMRRPPRIHRLDTAHRVPQSGADELRRHRGSDDPHQLQIILGHA